MATIGLASAVGVGTSSGATRTQPHVTGHALLVGTFDGVKGQYTTIQAAVNAAKPGDWILVAPGDYHETDDVTGLPTGQQFSQSGFGAVTITTSDIHLRGMNRNTVVVDGTKPNSHGTCSTNPADQSYGPVQSSRALGRNGIVVYKADDVSIENLTVCNFLSGTSDTGNGVWWNGGSGSATIGIHGYSGAYLTATDTFFNGESTAGTYGIFSSDSAGPATWNTIYASNQNDSGMYVGACQQQCDITIDKAWMENNALGYSGTNSGGAIVIEHSIFDNNEDGLDTNSAIVGNPPAPQNGECPSSLVGGKTVIGTSPITKTHSCWVVYDNLFKNNNNPNVPRAGSAAAGPTGTGMTISGGTNDTVLDNTFEDNGAWGILFVPYPAGPLTGDFGQTCAATGGADNALFGCVYDPKNDALLKNKFINDGYFKNQSNSDFGQITLAGGEPQDCFAGNVDPQGSYPTNLEKVQAKCGTISTKSNTGGALFNQVLCDSGYGTCSSTEKYPQPTAVELQKLPKASQLTTMPNPCAGVPNNLWCKAGKPI